MTDKDIKPELLGMHAINSFAEHDSAARAVMLSSHFGQKITLNQGDENCIQTGAEKEFGRFTFSIKMPVDAKIIKVIDRYPLSVGEDAIPYNPEQYIIYQDEVTQQVGCICVPRYISYDQYFGYMLKETPEASQIRPGSSIRKDTILYDSPAVKENGGYAFGIKLKMALMSHPSVAEDGIMISEDILPKLEFDIFERRVVEFGKNNYPLNIYGTVDNFKPFPEIGEMMGDHRILMMLREMDHDLSPVDMSIYDVCEPDFTHDTAIYGRGMEGEIVDIKVYHEEDPTGPTPTGMTKMLDKYATAYKKFCENILDVEHHLRVDYKRKYHTDELPMTPEFHQLVRECMIVLDRATGRNKTQKLNREYRKKPLDDYRVEFVIRYRIRPTVGFKMTSIHGNTRK